MEVLGYKGDADVWCVACAAEEYARGDADALRSGVRDREGNEVWPIFLDDEFDYPVHCTKCGEFLGNRLTEDGEEYVRAMAALGEAPSEWLSRYDYLFQPDSDEDGGEE